MSYDRRERRDSRDRGDRGYKREGESFSLLVRNLSWEAGPRDLRYAFDRYGEIKDVYIPRDYSTGRPRGFGFVEFYEKRDGEDAMYDMNGRDFMGRRLEIIHAQVR